jgi:site-specific recombinase XerD
MLNVSANVRLATIKTYARLALKASVLDQTEHAMMTTVKGYSHNESKRIDEQRKTAELPIRVGAKKNAAVSISVEQAAALMTQSNTPQGRRDALLMCLLLEHGLRVRGGAILEVGDFNLKAGTRGRLRMKV